MNASHEQTIAALSTPPGESGVAVVRMSGPDALCILDRVFRPVGGGAGEAEWTHRRLYHGHVVGADGEVVDEVVCGVFRGPDSYTGEDTVEISCHGSSLLVGRILRLVFAHGARAAEAGEFTKRAFLNGKMDLIQAEAVADLIHARSELQQRVAQEQLRGGLSKRIAALADELLGLLANIEANIDFIEEGIDTLDVDSALSLLADHGRRLDELLSSSPLSRPFREGYRVVISGPVNAGKSSLFNRLIGEERAIVTEVPGTTRDVLREPVAIAGLLFMLQDTAGLRGTADRVEIIGVDLARAAASEADIVLFVVDGSERLTDETRALLRGLDASRSVVVVSKTDLPAAFSVDDVRGDIRGGRIRKVSAVTGDGVRELRETLVECVGHDRLQWIARERIVLNGRLTATLDEARKRLLDLTANLKARAPLEILAVDAREVLQLYETATGRRYTEDLLGTIFSRFCVGK